MNNFFWGTFLIDFRYALVFDASPGFAVVAVDVDAVVSNSMTVDGVDKTFVRAVGMLAGRAEASWKETIINCPSLPLMSTC